LIREKLDALCKSVAKPGACAAAAAIIVSTARQTSASS
jgi:hypothetical protein